MLNVLFVCRNGLCFGEWDCWKWTLLIILCMILILLVSKLEGCILVIKHSLLKTRPSLSMIFQAINSTCPYWPRIFDCHTSLLEGNIPMLIPFYPRLIDLPIMVIFLYSNEISMIFPLCLSH